MPTTLHLDILDPASCDGCGLCCEGIGSPVLLYVSRPEWSEQHPFRPSGMPDDLIREIDDAFGGLVRGQEPQERCVWFDPAGRRCRHYEFRPQVCRDDDLGGAACIELRRPVVAGQVADGGRSTTPFWTSTS